LCYNDNHVTANILAVDIIDILYDTVNAQTAISAILFPPETRAFPTISAYLDVHDVQGDSFMASKFPIFNYMKITRVEIKEYKEIRRVFKS
jgi:hypothetical protein